MDDNTRDVLIAGITVAGTLFGVWVGFWLQDRRRHDAEKRRAYSTFVGLIEHAHAVIGRGAHGLDGFEASIWEATALIDMIGAPAVRDAASDVAVGMSTWLDARERQDGTAAEIDTRLELAIRRLVRLAQADLGVPVDK